MKGYEFRYDKLNRLGFADYFSQNQGKFDRTSTNREWITGYDKNGNITALDRHGSTQSEGTPMIDKLTYHYKGNQVIGIDDAIIYDNSGDFFDNGQYYYISHCVEYEYDANGNLTKDLNKGIISITYNELNLPETIDFGGNSRIQYDYDALGTKRRQTTTESGKMVKTIDFIGNFVYENDYPAYHNFDEGRIVYKPDSSCFVETYLKDHLGNIRVAYANDGVKDGIRQVNAYYPFGMNISSLSANSTSILQPNEYKYNGKMFQDELGLDWLDYGARFYDGVIGRWHSVDPLATESFNFSPYLYCRANPLIRIDPNGMLDELIINGEASDAAVAQIQSGTTMKITRTQTGKIEASGEAITKDDQKLLAVIESQDVQVNVEANYSTSINYEGTSYNTRGGAFMGNELSIITSSTDIQTGIKPFESEVLTTQRTIVNAKQIVNPALLDDFDTFGHSPGKAILHEITEAYSGGLISLKKGESALPGIGKGAAPRSTYRKAHGARTTVPQPGDGVITDYDLFRIRISKIHLP